MRETPSLFYMGRLGNAGFVNYRYDKQIGSRPFLPDNVSGCWGACDSGTWHLASSPLPEEVSWASFPWQRQMSLLGQGQLREAVVMAVGC